jgi:hypothetical protein
MAHGHQRPHSGQYSAGQGSQNIQVSARPQPETTPHLRREMLRARSQRASRATPEPESTEREGFSRSSIAAWVVLLGGMALAAGGVLQASLNNETSQASANEQTLENEVSQLKVQLDKERAEKTNLLEKMSALPSEGETRQVEAQAPLQPEPPTEVPEVAPETESPLAAEPASSDAEIDPGLPATSDDSTLPPPMAPSAELLNQQIAAIEPSVQKASSYGIHLASFGDRTMAERGWLLLQRNHPGALGALKPKIEELKDESGRPIFLLIAGPFETEAAAASHCQKINAQVVFCRARAFTGSEFAATARQ